MRSRKKGLWPVLLIFAIAHTVAAQGLSAPTGKAGTGLEWQEAFEGSLDPSGQVMSLTSSATYHLGEHFSLGAGLPVYFVRGNSSAGTTSAQGLGDFFLSLGSAWKSSALNYSGTLTGSAPTGNSAAGLSTGHATFDWNNRLDHDISVMTPFFDAGLGNSVTDTRFYHRPFTSYGFLAHLEAGTDVDLTHGLSLTLSGYDIAPWGTQTIISRVVGRGASAQGGPGQSGQHSRVFELAHQTTGAASINQDDGFTAGLDFTPKPYLDLDFGITRSVKFAFNSVSFGIDLNVSRLFSKDAAK